jgi:glycosyltransferase involved in cell wall biosynthesis
MNPKISVIIPTYNRANLLPRWIKSVLNQTYQDFELIVVDDGLTDSTRELVEEFQKKDSRIK